MERVATMAGPHQVKNNLMKLEIKQIRMKKVTFPCSEFTLVLIVKNELSLVKANISWKDALLRIRLIESMMLIVSTI